MRKIILSQKSDDDIEEIYSYGNYRFGKSQTIKYLEELNATFVLISNNPNIGRERTEIKKELMSFPYKSHVIFYRFFPDTIRIVRILYGGRDLVKFL